MDKNRGIGKNNSIPWNLKEERKFFSKITKKTSTGKNVVIMGRRTWFSIPPKHRPLKNRINIIISSTLKKKVVNVKVYKTLKKSLMKINKKKNVNKIFVIGGNGLYEEALKYCQTLYITEIEDNFSCDVFFPEFDEKKYEKIVLGSKLENDVIYKFCMYVRKM